MELPLETPTSANETVPRDRMNIRAPDQTRPPPEMMAGGYEKDEDVLTVPESEPELDDWDTFVKKKDKKKKRGPLEVTMEDDP